jgi:nitrate reductase NapE component
MILLGLKDHWIMIIENANHKISNMIAVQIIVIGLYYVLVIGLIGTFLKLLSK